MLAEALPAVTNVAAPRFIGAGDGAVFAWHHQPAADVRRGAGVILCPALGYEYMSAYRTWRLLAERLAARGFDVMRLDYHGTGSSAGDAEGPGRVEAWLRSIAMATGALRESSGIDDVAFVGLRAGALLALQAAAEAGGIDRLVLWSPFASGRSYIRELRAVARLNGQSEEDDGPAINSQGHLLSAETVEALSRWTAGSIASCPAGEVLIVDRADRKAEAGLEPQLTRLGSRVERRVVEGTAEMLLPPHLSVVPVPAIDGIVEWLGRWRTPLPPPGTRPAPAGDDEGLATGRYRERPVAFGADGRLFGMVTRPASASPIESAVIFLSTGAGHQVGPHRMYVPLAREWASRGHLVLRFDLGGIGDSPAAAERDAGEAYPERMHEDVRDAIALTRRLAPRARVVLAGLCSGGWLAFDAARRGFDVDGIVAINPPLYLRDGNREWVRQQRRFERYQQAARDPMKWVGVLRRRTSAAHAVREVTRRLHQAARERMRAMIGREPDGLGRDLRTIAGRDVRTLLVFSDGDNGLRYFEQHGSLAQRRVEVRDVVRHVVVQGAGHAFQPTTAQRVLRALLDDFVSAGS